jgi:hypothetical protein
MKLTPLIVAVVALGIGLGAGVGLERWRQRSVNDLLERIPITHTAANSTRCVAVLRFLRSGETDRAANMLEVYLDGDLMALGLAYRSATPEQRDAAWAASAIRMAREYREAHPHTPHPEIAGAVSETLSIPTP